MNNKEFVAELAQRSGYSQEDTQKLMRTVVDAMGQTFEEGGTVFFAGFGTFEVKKRLERTVISPATGQKMLVPPKLVLNFRPVASVKEKLKKGEGSNE